MRHIQTVHDILQDTFMGDNERESNGFSKEQRASATCGKTFLNDSTEIREHAVQLGFHQPSDILNQIISLQDETATRFGKPENGRREPVGASPA